MLLAGNRRASWWLRKSFRRRWLMSFVSSLDAGSLFLKARSLMRSDRARKIAQIKQFLHWYHVSKGYKRMDPKQALAGERFFRIYHDQDGFGFFLVPLASASAGGWEVDHPGPRKSQWLSLLPVLVVSGMLDTFAGDLPVDHGNCQIWLRKFCTNLHCTTAFGEDFGVEHAHGRKGWQHMTALAAMGGNRFCWLRIAFPLLFGCAAVMRIFLATSRCHLWLDALIV